MGEIEGIMIIHPIEDYSEVNLHKGVSQFAKPLRKMGYKVSLITYENEANKKLNPSLGVTFKKVKHSGIKKLTEPLREIIQGKAQLIFSQSLGIRNLVWALVAKLFGKTFLIKLDYMPKQDQDGGLVGRHKVRTKIELFLFGLIVDLFTVETPEVFNDLRDRHRVLSYKLLSSKLAWLPSGIYMYNGEYLPYRAERSSKKDIEKKNKILYVGRLSPGKDIETLIRAFNRIKDRYPSWSLEIVGRGPLKFKDLDKKRVIFTGFLKGNALLEKYKEAKIFCLPSRHEGFGNVLIEAASTDTAVISTKVGIAKYLLKDIGLLFEKGNIEELTEKLEYYINHKEERKEDARKLKKRASQFDLKNITKHFISAVKTIL